MYFQKLYVKTNFVFHIENTCTKWYLTKFTKKAILKHNTNIHQYDNIVYYTIMQIHIWSWYNTTTQILFPNSDNYIQINGGTHVG